MLTAIVASGESVITYAILPSFPWLMNQRLVEFLSISREFIETSGSGVITQFLIIKRITESSYNFNISAQFNCVVSGTLTSMSQEHPQSNPLILLHQGAIFLEHSKIIKLRANSMNLTSIIQRKPSLLNQLHARNTSNHLCARRNPKYRVHRHELRASMAPFPRSMAEQLLAVPSNYSDGNPGKALVGIAAHGLHPALERLDICWIKLAHCLEW